MNNSKLVKDGLLLMENPETMSETAVSHQIHQTNFITATLIAQQQPKNSIDHANLVKLVQKVDRHFNNNEIRDLCFQLDIDYEKFDTFEKQGKVRELVMMMDRHCRLSDLTTITTQLRPNIKWKDPSQQVGKTSIIAKLDTAVVVDITRPTIQGVAHYLDDVGIDANFLLLQNTHSSRMLSPDDTWDNYITAFSQTMNSVKNMFSGVRLHFFLSAPGALIFGLGCIWGTVDEAQVYHYQNNTYYSVISISRNLRN